MQTLSLDAREGLESISCRRDESLDKDKNEGDCASVEGKTTIEMDVRGSRNKDREKLVLVVKYQEQHSATANPFSLQGC